MKIETKEVFTNELEVAAETLMREHNIVVFVWDRNRNSTDCWRVLTDIEHTDDELDG